MQVVVWEMRLWSLLTFNILYSWSVLGSDALHARDCPQARTPHEPTALQRQIEATDRQIDALVYELYGLTEEEIAIVEGGARVWIAIIWSNLPDQPVIIEALDFSNRIFFLKKSYTKISFLCDWGQKRFAYFIFCSSRTCYHFFLFCRAQGVVDFI